MNKQQLASIIWESANQMRSKIEANEYKDFILGFIFYKYLSDKEVAFLKASKFNDENLHEINKSADPKVINYIKSNLGYCIYYDNLFSTWLTKGFSFDVSDVRDSLSSFELNVSDSYKKVFDNIFKTLRTSLSKLGDTAAKQTKAINKLLKLIRRIPMDNSQDYDVLGFIYEYLIGMFAANAGKKGGEFYTPNEVSVLMSEIISEHLKGRDDISIYDSASGSGSLLINIGSSASNYIKNKQSIVYYAQELKEYTYNLTRMNLIMRGINPSNIYVRNGDTLEEDWPFFEDNKEDSYKLITVDAVVSNPPYSQKWDTTDKNLDPRYRDYGVAPRGKSDLAFLLHDLYHLKNDGIMMIVLPHGVLFRGGEEAKIRENLINKNKIDAIIGLPANVFFGTGIPTIIILLKKERKYKDILIIDASKGYEKVGKNNKLRSRDIKKIVDVVVNRKELPKFSKIVSKREIEENEYNLNISRYVDTSEDEDRWDIHSLMFGSLSKEEIDTLSKYWNTFKGLREELFEEVSEKYMKLKTDNLSKSIKEHSSVIKYLDDFNSTLSTFPETLKKDLMDNLLGIDIFSKKIKITNEIFKNIEKFNLIDKYSIYEIFSKKWEVIANDLEIISNEGTKAIKAVEANMVIKNSSKDDDVIEIQEGFKGKILPFELIQEEILKDETKHIKNLKNRLLAIDSETDEIIDSFDEDEKESGILNEDKSTFISKELKSKADEIYLDIETKEIKALNEYLLLTKKVDKAAFVKKCKIIDWNTIDTESDNETYSKIGVNNKIKELKQQYSFDKDTFEYKVLKAISLIEEEKEIKREIKVKSDDLENLSKDVIESLNDDTALQLLEIKWITSLIQAIKDIGDEIVEDFISKIEKLATKYSMTFNDIQKNIEETSNEISNMIDEINGDAFDIQGLNEFKKLLEVTDAK